MFAPRYLYIQKKDTANTLFKRHAANSHYIDLPGGLIISSVDFTFEDQKDFFEQHDQVQPVAHDGETISEQHANVLAHLGVKAGHTAKQARAALKKTHGLM
jgi:hypothetical protein